MLNNDADDNKNITAKRILWLLLSEKKKVLQTLLPNTNMK